MTDAEILMQIFRGSDLAFGRSQPGEKKDPVTGKLETKSWTETRAVELKDWQEHLAGNRGLGIPPINSQNKVWFGAIDVDTYKGIDLAELAREIHEEKLPMVLFRSKSGGPHLFIFFKKAVDAKVAVNALDKIAGHLGFGMCEIFPKQVSIGQDPTSPDYGNWINMPYFDGVKHLRYAIDHRGEAITDIPELLAYVQKRQVDEAWINSLELKDKDEEDAHFADGPPCLGRIFAKKINDNRNIILSNVAVFLKKKFAEKWTDHLETVNRLFSEPLPSAEVEHIKKSYAKKDYRYMCREEPLCRYCVASECKRRAHGIGGDNITVNNRSLSKIETDPPLWFIDAERPDGSTVRVSLATEELRTYRLYQKRIMECLNLLPTGMKQTEWEDTVTGLLAHVSTITVPPEMTSKGMFLGLLEAWIDEFGSSTDQEAINHGRPFISPTTYEFRIDHLETFLEQRRFQALNHNQILSVLKTDLKGETMRRRIGKRNIRFWSISKKVLDIAEDVGPIIHTKDPF